MMQTSQIPSTETYGTPTTHWAKRHVRVSIWEDDEILIACLTSRSLRLGNARTSDYLAVWFKVVRIAVGTFLVRKDPCPAI